MARVKPDGTILERVGKLPIHFKFCTYTYTSLPVLVRSLLELIITRKNDEVLALKVSTS